MPARKPAPTIRLRRLATELRRLREDAGLTREEVVERTGINNATLYRIEVARVRPQPRTLMTLLNTYGVAEGEREELTTLLKDAGKRGPLHSLAARLPETYASYIEFETEACAVRNYESAFVPGLLQTADYARAVVQGVLPGAGPADVDDRVEARVQRQAVLNGDAPLTFWGIVDEAALRRPVGGAGVMRAQLRHLAEVARRPNVNLQVVPFGAGAHPGLPGSFVLMSFPEGVGSAVVYLDGQAGDMFLEEEADVSRYTLVFEHLRAAALDPAGSARLIAEAADGT
ncbi:helix-turn-helix transcriptional regulator [Actinomadura viridis]|uniref:Transcriptional regulator with XRE-family HTH domain n=1 Tax=Actinomadura viridis TaxID=58110 RepID=A0A931GN81_9ACTN|nr:helix-turn-helix transcriptional regulator [Actinomadura viridis]MBG6093482.1 transcriptional regulator with XRE-family HTH domain [Actinomadura viridis]